MPPKPESEQENIVEQLPYLNELMQAIRNVNDAILQNKDAREAAENLLSDLPDEWQNEISDRVEKEIRVYNTLISIQNKYLVRGFTPTQKYHAQRAIVLAGNDYARNIKKIVISLLKQKDLLFKTKRKVEQGSMSLFALGEPSDDE